MNIGIPTAFSQTQTDREEDLNCSSVSDNKYTNTELNFM
jgi:hypothetical protein